MKRPQQPRKTLREYITGLSIWGKIGWTIVLGYIFGRLVYWIAKIL